MARRNKRHPASVVSAWIARILALSVVGFVAFLLVGGVVYHMRARDPLVGDSALRQKYDAAQVDVQVARKRFDQGRRKEGEEYLSKAQDKAFLCEQAGVGAADLAGIKAGADEVESRNSDFVDGVRRRRARERLSSRAEAMRAALAFLEYRNRAWSEVLSIVQERVRRQAAGAEAAMESPFRVEPKALRGALSRRFGEAYLKDMEARSPGVPEWAVQEAEALAQKAAEDRAP